MRINFKQQSMLAMAFFIVATLPVKAELNVFACEPEYAALVSEIAGDNASVFSATTAFQDPHFVQARPSLISKMRRADLVVCAGAELEVSWLPMIQMKSNNRKVQSTDDGLFFASEHVENLDIPVQVDRSMGDVHVEGNPHVHLDPRRVLTLAEALTERIIRLDPKNIEIYQQRFADFSQRWQAAMRDWQQRGAVLNGQKVIAYHSSFRYLFDYFKMLQVGDLEPKPGLPPTTKHLMKLLGTVKKEQVNLVVYTGYQDKKAANWLQDKTGIKSLQLPYTINGNEGSNDLFNLMEQHLTLLLQVYQK